MYINTHSVYTQLHITSLNNIKTGNQQDTTSNIKHWGVNKYHLDHQYLQKMNCYLGQELEITDVPHCEEVLFISLGERLGECLGELRLPSDRHMTFEHTLTCQRERDDNKINI